MITLIKQLEEKLIFDNKTKYFVNVIALTKYKFDESAQDFVACADSRTRTITFGPEFFKRTESEQLNIFFEELLHIFLMHSHRIVSASENVQNFNLELFKLSCEIERQQIQEQIQFVDISDPTEKQINGIRKELLKTYDLNKLSAEQIYLILQKENQQQNQTSNSNQNNLQNNSQTSQNQNLSEVGKDISISDVDQTTSEINKEVLENAVKEIVEKMKNEKDRGFQPAFLSYILKLKKQKSIKNILSQIILRQRNKVIDFQKIHKKSEEILFWGHRKEKTDKILIIFDVSGSMGEFLDDAYAYVNQIAKFFAQKNEKSNNVRVVIADTDVIGEINPFKTEQKILGLGGTCLDIAYRNAVRDENVVIFVTDCYTDFPTKEETIGKSVYCISVTNERAPKHIKTFHV